MAEAPLVKDGKVVNVASSIVTTPLIKSGPCSDITDSSGPLVFVKIISGVWSSGTESTKAESVALRGSANSGDGVNLEDSVARVVHGVPGIRRGGVKCLWYDLSTECLSYVF